MKQKNTVALKDRLEDAIPPGRGKMNRGTIERTSKGRKFVPKAPENMVGFVGTGRNVKPIANPKRTMEFDGKTYYINANVVG